MAASEPASVSDNLKKAQHILRLVTDTVLQELGLTTAQYAVLSALSEQAGLSGAALARRCFVTPQTITGIVGNLEAAGLVARAPDPDHRRIIQTRLTSQGIEKLTRARLLVTAIEERMVADLDRAEREALADLLSQCADALQQRGDPPRRI
jgi:DNA-binding MarR family transcriptional regulator